MVAAASTSSAFHQTKVITRTNLINGQDVVVGKSYTVSLTVNVTSNLIERQPIQVSWTGAHPSGGIQLGSPDPDLAGHQEYPMVLLECHGNPSPSAPASQQIQPQDCWTSTPPQRYITPTPPQNVTDTPGADLFPPWRLDRYATAAGQRDATVNMPSSVPAACFLNRSLTQFWLPYVTPTGQSYPIGPTGCAGMPNEMSQLGGLGVLPSNETYAATGLDGRGSTNFDIWTSEVNQDLGCSQSVSCALVAVPIMGISCDPAGTGMPAADQPTPGTEQDQAAAACEGNGGFAPGSLLPAGDGRIGNFEQTVSGQLWWAASNWRNRFVVPLHFAPPGDICAIVNKGNHFIQAYGSELLDQAALQWQPHFCLNTKLFTLGYVATPEPEAATELQSKAIEAALVSQQPSGGFPEPVVHAPVAATAFAIGFVIDDSAGNPLTTLRFTPRLLAKLLTESYPAVQDVAYSDPELLHTCPGVPVPHSSKCTNPLDITLDPEFQALNPGITHGVGAYATASVLLTLSSQADTTWALTSYINADPAARAWLDGTPDPWGMTVNSAYKGIQLPVTNWPLNSTFKPPSWLAGNGGPTPCYAVNPSPVLPLIAAPVADLPTIAEDIQFFIAQPQLICVYDNADPQLSQLVALGPQSVGHRFMIAVTSLADANRYSLTTASLLTHTKPRTAAKFTSPASMTFVAPTDAALRSAASLFAADTTQHVWNFPYSLYGQNSVTAEQAYPGIMMVYADIPTRSLTAADAADYATFLRFAAAAGQAPGGAIGQLPPGYLPMTAANHLGAEAAYTVAAAAAVAAQKGGIPALAATGNGGTAATPGGSGGGTTPGGSGPGSGTGPGSGGTGSSSGGHAKVSKNVGGNAVPLGSSSPVANVALTPGQNFGLAGYVLLGVAGLAVAAAVAAAVTAQVARSRGKKWRFTLFGRKIWG